MSTEPFGHGDVVFFALCGFVVGVLLCTVIFAVVQ